MRSLPLLLALLSSSALAAEGVVPVQGQLYDAGGVAIDASVSVDFALYDNAEGAGTPLWSENQTVDVDLGSFTAYLGDATALDLSLFRDYSALYLGITIDGEAMGPLEIGTAPFAGYAEYAGTAGSADTVAGMSAGDLQPSAIESLATGVCYDTEAELTADLDDNYLPAGYQPDWSDIQNVPGDVGGTYAASFPLVLDNDAFGLTDACTSGVLLYDGSTWACSTVIDAVTAVDGRGSGLDADTLDGVHATGFARKTHEHGAADISSGVLHSDRYSARSDLEAEGQLNTFAVVGRDTSPIPTTAWGNLRWAQRLHTHGGEQIVDESLTGSDIADDSITGADIKASTLGGVHIANGSITGADIEDGSLGSADIADGSLTGVDIQDDSLTRDDIGVAAVTSAEIMDGSIFGADIRTGTITGAHIANESITGSDIDNHTLTGADIQNGSIDSIDIANGTITGTDIQDGSIAPEDLEVSDPVAAFNACFNAWDFVPLELCVVGDDANLPQCYEVSPGGICEHDSNANCPGLDASLDNCGSQDMYLRVE